MCLTVGIKYVDQIRAHDPIRLEFFRHHFGGIPGSVLTEEREQIEC